MVTCSKHLVVGIYCCVSVFVWGHKVILLQLASQVIFLLWVKVSVVVAPLAPHPHKKELAPHPHEEELKPRRGNYPLNCNSYPLVKVCQGMIIF